MPIHFLGIEGKLIKEKKTDDLVIEPADWPNLKELILARIRGSATDGTLQHTRDLIHNLFRWGDWAGVDEVRTWVA